MVNGVTRSNYIALTPSELGAAALGKIKAEIKFIEKITRRANGA